MIKVMKTCQYVNKILAMTSKMYQIIQEAAKTLAMTSKVYQIIREAAEIMVEILPLGPKTARKF